MARRRAEAGGAGDGTVAVRPSGPGGGKQRGEQVSWLTTAPDGTGEAAPHPRPSRPRPVVADVVGAADASLTVAGTAPDSPPRWARGQITGVPSRAPRGAGARRGDSLRGESTDREGKGGVGMAAPEFSTSHPRRSPSGRASPARPPRLEVGTRSCGAVRLKPLPSGNRPRSVSRSPDPFACVCESPYAPAGGGGHPGEFPGASSPSRPAPAPRRGHPTSTGQGGRPPPGRTPVAHKPAASASARIWHAARRDVPSTRRSVG